ncbi:hypothetical protein EJ08DRAFT_263054 [Tothia fuscella]|uniref:Uncharacterized protein n=1 Tax=Tothia fuscella TaxID=1048955 RepID=A0A9P4NQN3_9PEZI|nr:hypothetical protein EJ08DRAFT_263054 [Tothia fuscella]
MQSVSTKETSPDKSIQSDLSNCSTNRRREQSTDSTAGYQRCHNPSTTGYQESPLHGQGKVNTDMKRKKRQENIQARY